MNYSTLYIIGIGGICFTALLLWAFKYRNCCEALKLEKTNIQREKDSLAILLAHVLAHPNTHQISFLGMDSNENDIPVKLLFTSTDISTSVVLFETDGREIMGLKPFNNMTVHTSFLELPAAIQELEHPILTPFEFLNLYEWNWKNETSTDEEALELSETQRILTEQKITPVL